MMNTLIPCSSSSCSNSSSSSTPLCLVLLLLLLSISCTTARSRDTITVDSPLAENETLVSAGGYFALGFFNPPNNPDRYIGIWYNTIPTQTVVWVANRLDPVDASPSFLSLSPDGILTLSSPNSSTPLSTTATTLTNPVAQLLDTGNFVVREATDGGDAAAWQSFDYPTDTLIAGMKLGVDRRRGLNWTLTAWRSGSDPAPGEYYAAMDTAGDPEVFLYSVAGRARIWRTGPWDGVQFSGVPDTVTYQDFAFTFTNDADEVSYSFNVLNRSIISRLVVNQTGVVQRSIWLASGRVWNIFWYAPRDPCDDVSACGPYGLCDPNDSPMCSCVQGFEPRSPQDWALRDGSGGCVRRTRLDCANRTDGFAKVSHVKLPDTTNCTVDPTVGLDRCAARCSANCSCTAYAAANVSGGARSGCVMWHSELTDMRVYVGTGQDLYVRLAAADLGSAPSQSGKSDHAPIALIVGLTVVAFLLACAGCYIWRRRKLRKSGPGTSASTISFSHEQRKEESIQDSDIELPLFDLGTIAVATEGFSNTNKLGEGGFGPVYRGKLGDGQEIAVKTLAKTSVQGLDEFKNEVMLIAKLQHRNLVRLLGCCIQGEERMLIYEYMENKSLDMFLFDKAYSASLNWQTRYRIIEGIARGLVYLHQDSRFRVIHRDLKASNILLDKEMSPKISDFGMARIFGGDETEVNTRKVVGTYGYMSPEYAMDGIFSVKSDVFSFGVLVLEIISGRRNRGAYVDSSHLNLLAHAWSLWNEGKSLELVDDSMDYSFLANEVLKCAHIGLLCVQEHPEDRPLMSAVVLMLGSDGASLPTPKQPGFARRRIQLDTESSSSKQDSITLNDMTITMIEGR
ncbi:receptor-like serine/threonine-protein kinase SD1-8 isoform X2 [Ananas comosus]|uniref:Receptor-like serine/threonine-protein kinase n=1 Tax=Ananas comosus TaxID=4615 RepID=A0A6P5FDW6_ANACO|nr:receptor-like serine/threonine-protein kinase SD1-8 isoform X2 [Ananas comosus]